MNHDQEALLRRIAELEERCSKLEREAHTDALTSLPNRRYLEKRLDDEIARAARHSRQMSLVIIDIDKLKSINDSQGHASGDAALRSVGEALRTACRSTDVVGRWGGDEYLVLLPDTGAEGAVAAVERIRVQAANASSISAGYSTMPRDGATAADLLKAADHRLYEFKSANKP